MADITPVIPERRSDSVPHAEAQALAEKALWP